MIYLKFIKIKYKFILFLLFLVINCVKTEKNKDYSRVIFSLALANSFSDASLTGSFGCSTLGGVLTQIPVGVVTEYTSSQTGFLLTSNNKSGVRVRVTLLEDGCSINRTYGYCDSNLNFVSLTRFLNFNGISCSDSTPSSLFPIIGKSNTYEECDLTVPNSTFQAYLNISPNSCKFSIQYSQL